MAVLVTLFWHIILISVVLGNNKMKRLERKIYHMESSIQHDLTFLRENVDTNTDEIQKLTKLVNDSLSGSDVDTTETIIASQKLNDSKICEVNAIAKDKISSKTIAYAFKEQKMEFRTFKENVKATFQSIYEKTPVDKGVSSSSVNERDLNISIEIRVATVREAILKNVSDTIFKFQSAVQNKTALQINDLHTVIIDGLDDISAEIDAKVIQMVSEAKSDILLKVARINQVKGTEFEAKIGKKVNDTVKTLNIALTDGDTRARSYAEDVRQRVEKHMRNALDDQKETHSRTLKDLQTQVDRLLLEQNSLKNGIKNEMQHITNSISTLTRDIETMKAELSVKTNAPSRDRNVRLTNGGYNSGRLEVLYNGMWGTVCGTFFGRDEATVVCRSLGFSRGIVKPHAFYGEGNGNVWLSFVKCQGTELSIFDCSAHRGTRNSCGHHSDVGVQCH